MKEISSWAVIICMAAAAATVLNMMTPSGNMNKIFKYVLGVFLISSIIIPISQISPGDFSLDTDFLSSDIENTDFTADIKNEYMANTLVSLVESELENIGVKPLKTEILMDNLSDSGISINKVAVTIRENDKYNALKISDTLKKNLGLSADIYIEEENNG